MRYLINKGGFSLIFNRRGRPKLTTEEKHSKRLVLRLTESENSNLEKMAQSENMAKSSFIRHLISDAYVNYQSRFDIYEQEDGTPWD